MRLKIMCNLRGTACLHVMADSSIFKKRLETHLFNSKFCISPMDILQRFYTRGRRAHVTVES